MKRSVLKSLIREVITALKESPDRILNNRGKYLSYDKSLSYSFILTSTNIAGIIDTLEKREHADIENALADLSDRESIAYVGAGKYPFPEDVNQIGLTQWKDFYLLYNASKFGAVTGQYEKDFLFGRFFIEQEDLNKPIVALWPSFSNLDAKKLINKSGALYNLIKDMGYDLTNCDFEDGANRRKTYDQFINDINDKMIDPHTEELAKLNRKLHTADPVEKNKIRKQIDALTGQTKNGAGSSIQAHKASKAGYNNAAAFNAARSIDEIQSRSIS